MTDPTLPSTHSNFNPWQKSRWWRFVYRFYPPILRVLERVRIHNYRQPYLLGTLAAGKSAEDLYAHLATKGYSDVILAWRDPGEVLGLRKVDREVFQYHLRLFDNGDLTGHYEYASESNPFAHVFQSVFEPRTEDFHEDLGGLLQPLVAREVELAK